MKYLVTGGAGFIGYHLVKKLAEDGHAVDFIDNCSNGDYSYNNWDKLSKLKNVRGYPLDITYQKFPDEPYDGIFHLAATPRVQLSFDRPIETNHNNLTSLLRMLEYAKKNKIKRFVSASSSTAGTAMSPYGVQKLCGEYYVKLYTEHLGLSGVSLRYFSVYGNNMDEKSGYALLIPKLIDCALNGTEFTLYGDGSVKRDFTFIDDIVDATIKAMDSEYVGVLEVGYGEPQSVATVIKSVEEITGQLIKINQKPERVEPKTTEAKGTWFTQDVLGWEPQTSFSEGIRKCVEDKLK